MLRKLPEAFPIIQCLFYGRKERRIKLNTQQQAWGNHEDE